MKLAQKKKYLVVPSKSRPIDWPDGWAFPGVWPPGWPKDNPVNFTFELSFKDSFLTARCLDEHSEDTDEALGQMLHIGVFNGADRYRLSADGDTFSACGLFQINEYQPGRFGIKQKLVFDVQGQLDIRIRLFGWENGKWAV